jgi:hypothetical protein
LRYGDWETVGINSFCRVENYVKEHSPTVCYLRGNVAVKFWVEDAEGAVSEISFGEMDLAHLGKSRGKPLFRSLCKVRAIGRIFNNVKAWGKDVTFREVPLRYQPIVYVGWL